MSDEQLLAAVEKTVNTAVEAMKVDLLEHIHAVGGQLHTQIQEVVERLDRIVTKLDGQCDVLEGALRSSPRAIEWSEIGGKAAK